MQSKKRIPVSENVAYTHWEMPDLTGVKRRIAQRLTELQEEEKSQVEEVVEPVMPSHEEIEAIKEQARQEGYALGFSEGKTEGEEAGRATGYQEGEETGQEAGFQVGYQRGLDQAEQEVDQQLARLQSLIEQLQGPIAALDNEVESALLSLVDLVCRAILRREIKIDRSFLSEVLQEAVAALPVGHQRLRIFLNPEDLNLAEAACQDLLEEYRLVGDSEVTLGGVKIETLQSLVDSTLENRYKKIIDKLVGGVYQSTLDNHQPLPDDVLSTPDTPPLDEAVFTEPRATELQQPEAITDTNSELASEQQTEEAVANQETSALEEKAEVEAEPVAQVSLQRGKVPRHEQNLSPLTKDEGESAASTMTSNNEPPLANEPDLAEPNEDTETLDSEISQDASPNNIQNGDNQAVSKEDALEVEQNLADLPPEDQLPEESLEASSDEVDEFLDEFEVDAAETEFEAMLADSTATSASQADEPKDELVAEEAESTEKNWAPESVHDDRYLEDVLESTWLDDLQEPEDNPSDTSFDNKPSDENG
ncbi:FliH/SctL family protein [Marinospirillum insulare]|uniref:Flagellar assembly protein FliH n=1 Tax=Marinospirillum insulare TaxID=217169 RepID=A0ABQ6A1E5_9GAMM|nr:FliH/SctL family protein [Marinospirillum insulare]GLR63920.1 hypothetical protein GCM10007878_13570 [Marinospirillum insulare]